MSDLSHDPPGVQGLAQLGRNAIDRVSELERGIAERDETIRQLRAHLGNLLAMIHRDGGHYHDTHGTAKAVDDAIKVVAERNAQLDEYERAPTVATVFDGIHGTSWEPYICESEDVDLPPPGTELIARPSWAQGIVLIDAAWMIADDPAEGEQL